MALRREQIEYAAFDAVVLTKLADTLMRKIDRAGLRKTHELERRVSHARGGKMHGVVAASGVRRTHGRRTLSEWLEP